MLAYLRYNNLMQRWIAGLKVWAQRLEKEVLALYYAYRDPRTPWYAKLFCAFIITMTVSPIDLIPDFIPVLGYLDDALFLPLGIWIAIKMIPASVMAESREKARSMPPEILADKRKSILMIISIWVIVIAVIALVTYLIARRN
jgi:uncharacterized membrane protein YkvA (DUF1232 family)